jgi:hypothetical protein
MATQQYMSGRQRYQRPQGALWSENPGTLVNGFYLPDGYEIGSEPPAGADSSSYDQFIILSDHNRGEIKITPERIEQRQRTINGRMRSYHVADKNIFTIDWSMLPSRAYSQKPSFDLDGLSPYKNINDEYTSDGGAGGAELLDWYNNHTGPFWMFLSYDNYPNFGKDSEDYNNLNKYSQIVEVYFTDFSYSVVKRGGTNFDLWNISVTLEEA